MFLRVEGLVGVLRHSGEASWFLALMELTGITEQLQQMHEFTVFLPSDGAIQVSHVSIIIVVVITFIDTADRTQLCISSCLCPSQLSVTHADVDYS